MADADKQDIVDLSLSADRLRVEPAFQQAVLNLRREAVDALISADPDDGAVIRTHQASIKAIDGLCGELAAMIRRGTPHQGPTVA